MTNTTTTTAPLGKRALLAAIDVAALDRLSRTPTLGEVASAAHAAFSAFVAPRKVLLRFRGTTAAVSCYAEHVVLYLPALDLSTRVPRDTALLWCAYWAHEAGHVLHTDWTVWSEAVKENLHNLVNGLEDARMERAVVRSGKLANARALFDRSTLWLVEGAEADAGFRVDDPKQFAFVLAIAGRAALSGSPHGADWINRLPMFSGMVAREALRRLDKARDTADVLAIARWIAAQCSAAPSGTGGNEPSKGNEPGSEPSKGNANEPSKGNANEPSKGNEPGEGAGDEPGNEPGEGAGDEPGNEPGEGAGNEPGEGGNEPSKGNANEPSKGEGEGGQQSGSPDAPDDNARPAVKDTDGGRKTDTPPPALPGTQSADAAYGNVFVSEWTTMHRRKPSLMPDIDGMCDIGALPKVTDASRQAAPLRLQFSRLLRAPESRAWEGGQRAGRVLSRSFVPMVAGRVDVFAHRVHVPGVSTAVHVVLDGSGSMGGNLRWIAANGLALAIAQSCQAAGAPCMVSVFGHRAHLGADHSKGIVLSRAPLYTVKGFAEPVKPERFTAFPRGGHTPLTGAMLGGWEPLRAVANVNRRILFVLTDGDCTHGAGAVRAASAFIRREGGTVVVFGIGQDVSGLAPVTCTVRDGQPMTSAAVEALVRAIDIDNRRNARAVA